MSKKIGLIFWDGWLGVAPTLISLIEYYSEKDNQVYVYLRDDNEFDLSIIESFNKERVTVYRISSKGDFLKKRLIDYIVLVLRKIKNAHWISVDKFNAVVYRLEQLKFYLDIINFSNQIKKRREKFFDAVFCVDTIGLFTHKKSRIKSGKTINLSLEILYDFENDKEWLNRLLKKNEREYLKTKILFTLIQDEFRWGVYKKINNVTNDNFLLLPNSTRKSTANERKEGSDFFYKKFNLDPDTLIVLSAGMICDEVLSLQIAQVLGSHVFNEKVKVIFHNRLKNDMIRQLYIEEVRLAGKKNLLLSLDPVPFSELNSLFNSAHIGLVIYDINNADENFSAIGAASGKLYQYLKYGLPVIASDTEGLRKIILENQLGVIINNPIEIPFAIEKIKSNYHYFSNNAKKAFEEKLNIDIYLDALTVSLQ